MQSKIHSNDENLLIVIPSVYCWESTDLKRVVASERTESGSLWIYFTASFLQQSGTYLCI